MYLRPQLSSGRHDIVVDGITQTYHVHGEGPICIVHPGGPGIDWTYLRIPQVEPHLTMVYLEPIGTGTSGRLDSHPRGYSVARFARQLGDFIEALDLPEVLLLGHSHGGFVVQQLTLDQPERIAGIILYGTAAVTGGAFMQAAAERVAAFVTACAGTQAGVDAQEAWASLPGIRTDADYTEVLRKLLPVYFADFRKVGHLLDSIRGSLRAHFLVGDGRPFDVRADLPSLRLPALVLAGEGDFICGPQWASQLGRLIPAASVHLFPNSGHFTHLEQPEEFEKVVKSFVGATFDQA